MSRLYDDNGLPNVDQILARIPRDLINDLPIDTAACMCEALGLKLSQVMAYFEEEGDR